MKRLGEGLPDMQNISDAQESLTRMLKAGQETNDGKKIIQSAQPLINHKRTIEKVWDQAMFMKSVMQRKKPKRICKGMRKRTKNTESPDVFGIEYVRLYEWDVPETTDDEAQVIEQCRKACPRNVIVDLMARYLEMHKINKFTSHEKRQILYTDNAAYLYGYPEYALTLGVIDIVRDKDIVHFPNLGEIEHHTRAHLVEWPDSTELEVEVVE